MVKPVDHCQTDEHVVDLVVIGPMRVEIDVAQAKPCENTFVKSSTRQSSMVPQALADQVVAEGVG
eukprot:3638135-Pyramimonas_sp.AAC.1